MSPLNFDEFLCHNLSLHSVKYLKNLLSAFCQFLPSYLLRDHPYITSPYGLGGWVKKMAISADVQYCIYADIVGGSKICQDVIYGWSLTYLPSSPTCTNRSSHTMPTPTLFKICILCSKNVVSCKLLQI